MKGGSANGPFPVVGGSHPAQVAHLAIGAGNWTVFAKGLLYNTTSEVLVSRPVRCVLAVAGAVSDIALASPLGGGADSSREAFLLTLSVHQTSAGTASLRCAAPGSATGEIVVTWIHMAAFKTAGLSMGPLGESYQQFGNTAGPSQVYQVRSKVSVSLPEGAEGPVASIILPAGNWAITAKATVIETSSSSSAVFSCSLSSPGDLDRIRGAVDLGGAVADRLPIALEQVHHFGASGSVVLNCATTLAGGTTKIRDIRITAYKTTGLVNKNLQVDPNFAAFGPGVKPVVDAGFVDGPIPITGDSSFHPMAGMSLQAGKWVIVVKAYLENTSATTFRLVRCRVGPGSGWDIVELQLPSNGTIDKIQPLVLAWSGSFAARKKVIFSCRADGAGVTVNWIKMIAYKAGTLQTVPIH